MPHHHRVTVASGLRALPAATRAGSTSARSSTPAAHQQAHPTSVENCKRTRATTSLASQPLRARLPAPRCHEHAPAAPRAPPCCAAPAHQPAHAAAGGPARSGARAPRRPPRRAAVSSTAARRDWHRPAAPRRAVLQACSGLHGTMAACVVAARCGKRSAPTCAARTAVLNAGQLGSCGNVPRWGVAVPAARLSGSAAAERVSNNDASC